MLISVLETIVKVFVYFGEEVYIDEGRKVKLG